MMDRSGFIPDTPKEEKQVPFFEDASSKDGWQGHTTTKSPKTLQAEISNSIARLGGMVVDFKKGRFGKRDGYQILYTLSTASGPVTGRINVAALPVREFSSWDRRHTKMDNLLPAGDDEFVDGETVSNEQ